MAITPPNFRSKLSVPMQANNFLPVQSAQLSVSNAGASGSQSVTFTDIPGTQRITAKITNSGTKGCYVATGHTTAVAVVSTGTPQPASGDRAVSNCDYIAAGSIITQDYVPGTNTFAALCAGSDTTVLEVSVGFGQ